jgi:pSer/pThr/pTyr-binding forkhead associated (FHA) protein
LRPGIEIAAVFKLTIEDDEGKTTVIPLIRDEMTIGRQDGNTIRLTERNISRKHARLLRQSGTIYVEDLASYTGVRVNGARIVVMTPVAEGDEVQIGDYKLMVRIDRPAAAFNPDRATMPAMPAVLGPMNSVGGSVAIPTRGTPAMAAQAVPGQPARKSPVVAVEAARVSGAAPVIRPSAPVPHGLSAVPDPLEAQPTIPVRTLSESPGGTHTAAVAETNARLVVLTSEIAGQEFSLSRASVVIGRTEENDLVINHRSISRHHAKIVREGDRYTIVDLQSANGVRVNNEDYERIELHAGDVVELGHVKLRFVGPFEHYVFDPNVKHDRRPFPVKIAAGVGAAVVVIGVALVLRSGRAPEPASAPAPQAVAAGTSEGTPPAPPPAKAAQTLFGDATRAVAAEDWAGARAALDKLGPSTGDATLDRQASDLGKIVDSERRAAAAFGLLGEAATTKQYAAALTHYEEIPDGSVYKTRGRARADEARALLVAEKLADAEKARAAGRCADVRDDADEVEKLDPKNQLPKQLVRMCRAKPEPVAARSPRPRAVVAAAPVARAERQTEKPQPVERAEAAPAEPEADADSLMKQAREAWLRQQCGSAIELSRKALKVKPGLSDAYQIIAVCSCSLKDVDGATRAYAKLDERNRNLVHSLCQKNGIIVGAEQP